MTPLAVSRQTLKESDKFGIESARNDTGKIEGPAKIIITNYEKLHKFDPDDFSGAVCDESSILKNFNGTRKAEITEFMRRLPYRLLCTATASPNDYIELGTSSEALGQLGYMDMLAKFFKNTQNDSLHTSRTRYTQDAKWRFKGHAELHFWRWVCSWARALRKPSDLGFDDAKFMLPELTETEHLIARTKKLDGYIFAMPAIGLKEQREEIRSTIQERCQKAAELSAGNTSVLIWCHLNEEGRVLRDMIPGAIEVSGSDSDEQKEEKFWSFEARETRVLITKPKIGGFGLNWQHCNRVIYFPSHSFEQYYQAIRRCWRFGQEHPVIVDVIVTEGLGSVLKNLQRKAAQADVMFSNLVKFMNEAESIKIGQTFKKKEKVPSWLSMTR